MRTLIVVDRATGETQRIRGDDPKFSASIRRAARSAGLRYHEAVAVLESGGELMTPGFIRRFSADCPIDTLPHSGIH
jgi:hypothetical protein